MKVLVIEDSPEVINSLKLCFRMRWPDVQVVTSNLGTQGIELVEKEFPDIIVLDLGLPDMDGVDVLKQIRGFSQIPVVVLTVRNTDEETVNCLEEGADDFVTKPFSALALLARMQALLRRQQHLIMDQSGKPFSSGNLVVDFASRQVACNGRQIQLTPTEYSLLCYLISNRNRVVTHRSLLHELWGEEYDEVNTIKTFVSQLRHKFDNSGVDFTKMLVSIRGIGYKFVTPP